MRPLVAAAAALAAAAPFAVAAPAWAQVGSSNITVADPPVAHPSEAPCVVTLFSDVAFADFSPKTFDYAPACKGPWEKVVFAADFAVTAGVQFDRTANVWIGGANVYFGTTSEPSSSGGKSWHVERDVTDYASLLTGTQPGEVDLGNLVNSTYTGIISGSATLSFYRARHEAPRTPDVVLPLADHATGGTVALNTSADSLSRSFTLPRNIERAYLDVIAQSQGGDEFWYLCVPDDVAGELQSCGGGGFRETQVSIDGTPAGVAPVYPWIFTGGIDPFLWSPTPGVQTLNFAPYRVDLSPFAGQLSDGKAHTVAISVFGADNYFSATASLLLYLDRDARTTRGEVTRNTLAAPAPTTSEKLTTASDGTISGSVGMASARSFVIEGFVDTSRGRVRHAVEQRIDFANTQTFVVGATQYSQVLQQRTRIDSVSRDGGNVSARRFEWPLDVSFGYTVAADGTASESVTVGQRDESRGDFDISSNRVDTTDTLAFDASGNFTGDSKRSSSQSYFAADGFGRCYSRKVVSASGVVTQIADGKDCN